MTLRVLGIVAVVTECIVVSAVVFRILTDPCNHIGLDPRWLWGLYALPILFGLCLCLRERRISSLAAALIAAGALGLIFGIAVDQFNILVEYETWIDRGMPARPF